MALHTDLIILLPGILGSSLAKDGKPLWGSSIGSISNLVFSNALDTLALNGSDDGQDDIGDGVEVTGVVPNVEIIPGFWKHGGYSIVSRSLRAGIRVEQGKNYFEFGYDWRRDNRVSARRLDRFAREKLKAWQKDSGNENAKVVLVAHSMGGLVSRYFIECLEGWRITRRLISIGTPFRGSLDSLGTICNGAAKKIGPITIDATKASRTFQSLYQLLPIYPVIGVGDAPLVRVDSLDLPNLDRSRASAALQFHTEVRDAHEDNLKRQEYQDLGELIAPTVGVDQPTFLSARVSTAGQVELLRTYEGKDLYGDGTVPRVSAVPVDFKGVASHVANTHSVLPNDEGAMHQFRGLITADDIEFDKFRSSTLLANIGLDVEDAYASVEPFEIAARVSDYRQTLLARVDRVDEVVASRELTLRPAGDIYKGRLSLEPGVYKVSVSAEGAKPAEDIFAVVAAEG